MASLRIDPDQRFTCSQCGRCCHGWEVVVSEAELESYRRRNVAAWFDDADPFERLPGQPHLHTIRKRNDGACVFLTEDNKCRIHVELGAAKKPLTCRLFPYSFHPAPDTTVVRASFACPTIVANQGALIATGESLTSIESLRKEWRAAAGQKDAGLELVAGRSIDARSSRLLRDNLIRMLKSEADDVRVNIRRIAATLDDVSRSRVISLGDAEFAEYLSLTVPHRALQQEAPPRRDPGAVARMLQYGFLYTVVATRAGIEYPRLSRTELRLARLHLLAHFHGLAPGRAGINVKALKRRRVDINASGIRPIVFHYLRSTLETLGASGRPLIGELAIQVSYLNAARALAAMSADTTGRDVDREIFSEALLDASDVSHGRHRMLDWVLDRFSAGNDALWHLAS